MFDDNIKYPGIIGKNAKFPNLRFFVDYVINNIKLKKWLIKAKLDILFRKIHRIN